MTFPADADDYEHGMRTMAGTVLHYVTSTPQRFADFTAYLDETADDAGIPRAPREAIRLIVSRSHDFIVPDCPEPIEVM